MMVARPKVQIDPSQALAAVYEEMMWLAHRPSVTPSMARAWYTHIVANSELGRQVRRFSGRVSRAAVNDAGGRLVLEHPDRLQARLTALVEDHVREGKAHPEEFINGVLAWEKVNIVTFNENYAARKNGGNYRDAGIILVEWHEIDTARQVALWKSKLRGKVANAADFAPVGPNVEAVAGPAGLWQRPARGFSS